MIERISNLMRFIGLGAERSAMQEKDAVIEVENVV